MYLFAFFVVVPFLSSIGQNIDGDIDINGPEPLVPHTSIDEPAVVPLGNVDGCICREKPKKMSVFYGSFCKKFPSIIKVKAPVLKFRNTLVNVILKDDFQMLENLTYMEIESNLYLTKFEPGCFRNMNKLMNLSISFNEKLKHLDINVFEGLFNLKEIYLRNNGFERIIDVTNALSIKYVPNLRSLILNRNFLKEMNKNDFLPMEGTLLETLNLILCQIDYIHPDVLKPLKRLTALRLGENLFNVKTITNLIERTIEFGIPLRLLNLYEVGFRATPPKKLLEAVAKSNITYLNLGRNHFERLKDDSFPIMPNLETLVLRDDVTVDISKKTFYGMPNLKYLALNGNRLTYIHEGILIKTLIFLDLSANSNNLDTHFEVPDNIFKDMLSLQRLTLSFNQIEGLSASTFNGLSNLTILDLNNAYINIIQVGAFSQLQNLKKLNLENNFIGLDTTLTADIFKGLHNLQVLLLGGCHISNLTSHTSLFIHIPNLIYLGLQRNGLHIISPNQFPPITYLYGLDLSDNNLTPWTERLLNGLFLKYLNGGQNKFTSVSTAMLEDFTTLDELIFDGNPFICDCSWYPVANWLLHNTIIIKPSNTDYYIATCMAPDNWRRISVVDYLHYLQNHTSECEYKQLSNKVPIISFSCIFIILIICLVMFAYYYRWNIRYLIFLAKKEIIRRQKLVKINKRPAISNYEYSYDAFVSYCNEDKSFVVHLVDALENFYPYLKLCVYERDFQIGTVISEAVMQNISKSKRIILIVSDSFARSQWCRWEMQLAECHQLNDNSEDGLLLIRLQKVLNKNMTPFLKYIMKTRIYLEWDTDEKKEKIFWDKLRSTLSAPKQQM